MTLSDKDILICYLKVHFPFSFFFATVSFFVVSILKSNSNVNKVELLLRINNANKINWNATVLFLYHKWSDWRELGKRWAKQFSAFLIIGHIGLSFCKLKFYNIRSTTRMESLYNFQFVTTIGTRTYTAKQYGH